MADLVNAVLSNADAFRWIFFIGLLWAFYSWMQGDNGLEWRDYISSIGPDGKFHGDINKLGQVTGIAFGSVALVLVSPNAKDDFTGFALVLTAYFAFVGCAAGYAAYLRSKNNLTQTTTTTEPATDPATIKTTTVVTEPAKAAKKGK